MLVCIVVLAFCGGMTCFLGGAYLCELLSIVYNVI